MKGETHPGMRRRPAKTIRTPYPVKGGHQAPETGALSICDRDEEKGAAMGYQETYWEVESEEKARELAALIAELPENRMTADLTLVDGIGIATLKVDVDTRFGRLEKGGVFLVVGGERYPLQAGDKRNPIEKLCGTMPIPLECIHGGEVNPDVEVYVKL